MPTETKNHTSHAFNTDKTMHQVQTMADTVTESMKNGFEATRKMTEAFFKPFGMNTTGIDNVPTFTTIANRQIAAVTGMVDMWGKWATETTRVAVEHGTTMTKAWERMARQMTGVEKTDAARMPETAKTFVTEAIDTAAKTSERLVRMGVTHAEQTQRLMDETFSVRNGN